MDTRRGHSVARSARRWARLLPVLTVVVGLLPVAGVGEPLADAASGWQHSATGLQSRGAVLALDAGRPRVLHGPDDSILEYAWCDTECHDKVSWHAERLRENTRLRGLEIAIDPWHRPRIAYIDLAREGIFYAACDADCHRAESWSHVKVDSTTQHDGISLALDPWGRPRLAYLAFPDRRFTYAACDTACTAPQNWSTVVLQKHAGSVPSLDLEGIKPRIAYQRRANTAELRFFTCEDGCLDRLSWKQTTVASFQSFGNPSLAVEGSRAHIAFNPIGNVTYLGYVRCERDCSQAGNWSQPKAVASHHAIAPQLAVVDGRPRIAYEECDACFTAAQKTYLAYASCDASCVAASTSWSVERIAGDALEPAFALDGERPRVVFEKGLPGSRNPLRYASCDAPCGSPGTWPPPPSSPPPDDTDPATPDTDDDASDDGTGGGSSPAPPAQDGTGAEGPPTGGSSGSTNDGGDAGEGGIGAPTGSRRGVVASRGGTTEGGGSPVTAEAEAAGWKIGGDDRAAGPEEGGTSGLARLPGAAFDVVTNPSQALSWPWGRISVSALAGLLLALVGRLAYVEGMYRYEHRRQGAGAP